MGPRHTAARVLIPSQGNPMGMHVRPYACMPTILSVCPQALHGTTQGHTGGAGAPGRGSLGHGQLHRVCSRLWQGKAGVERQAGTPVAQVMGQSKPRHEASTSGMSSLEHTSMASRTRQGKGKRKHGPTCNHLRRVQVEKLRQRGPYTSASRIPTRSPQVWARAAARFTAYSRREPAEITLHWNALYPSAGPPLFHCCSTTVPRLFHYRLDIMQ